MVLSYALFYCTATRKELLADLGINPKDLRWLVNAPTHLMDDNTVRVWEYILQRISKRIGELFAVRNVINHKLQHIRKARVEQELRRMDSEQYDSGR